MLATLASIRNPASLLTSSALTSRGNRVQYEHDSYAGPLAAGCAVGNLADYQEKQSTATGNAVIINNSYEKHGGRIFVLRRSQDTSHPY
jgi:hypothetical protein